MYGPTRIGCVSARGQGFHAIKDYVVVFQPAVRAHTYAFFFFLKTY